MRFFPIRTLLRPLALAVGAALAGPAAWAQHGQPFIEARTRQGTLLERIQREQDLSERLKLLSEFASFYPRSKSLLWVLESMQAVYLARREFTEAIAAGDRALRLYPADIDTAQNCLKAAAELNDFEATRKYAVEVWKRASWLQKRTDAEGEAARQAMSQAEYSLSLLAVQSASAANRQAAVTALARLNPESLHLPNPANNTADRSVTGTIAIRPQPAPLKNPEFTLDLENEDALVAEAERLTRLGGSYWKVLDYSQRAIRILQSKTVPPEGGNPEAWREKHDRYLTGAYWMSGFAATVLGRYSIADRDLRAALPSLRGNSQALGLTLYSLGFVNYRLAEDGDRKRIFDALKFNRQCAAIPGAYREQALRNIESIKSYYNMK